MSAKLHYSPLTPVSISARSEDPNHPATNALTPQVGKPYRSGVGITTEWLQVDLGSSIAGVVVAVNAISESSVSIYADNSTTPTTLRGTITSTADNNGRRKISFPIAAAVRYIRVSVPGGGIVEFGALLLFGSTLALPRDPLYGATIEHVNPQQRDDLPNGRSIVTDLGAAFSVIDLPFKPRATEDIEQAKRLARAGICWLDLGTSGEPWNQWPVRMVEASSVRRKERPASDSIALRFREDC